jgi:hypothetical protein
MCALEKRALYSFAHAMNATGRLAKIENSLSIIRILQKFFYSLDG